MPAAYICFPGAKYTQDRASDAAHTVLKDWTISVADSIPTDSDEAPTGYDAYVTDYDLLPFDRIAGKNIICSSYYIRKALIRKHYLAHLLNTHSIKKGVALDVTPPTWILDIQFADELDEMLADDLYDLRDTLVQNKDFENPEWFILKPGMADQGNGIQLFSSLERLQEIFEAMEEQAEDGEESEGGDDQVYASQLRHYVIQKYLSRTLLVALDDGDMHKFHLRAYVICVGGLQVYLHDEMLALFASAPYELPNDSCDLSGHLSNTCLGSRRAASLRDGSLPTVSRFSELSGKQISAPGGHKRMLTANDISSVHDGAVKAIGTVFGAVAREASVHWQMWPNAFEIFGVDLMVTVSEDLSPDSFHVWLLEVNAVRD
ncbi:putative tubulin--tyrosine ligase pby1 [Malassezia yamatoensis]|uniref:Tubulin--tyrosine ligase pby1 n=1 Tax=Malassezia yamatoensis TaxID=253288 RepID=A0AAJ6CG94_9BASI|nr:putative tubulin--tyrosine ligase pby1 [Malassezia yamatoensis]